MFPDIKSIIQGHIPEAFSNRKDPTDLHLMVWVSGIQTYSFGISVWTYSCLLVHAHEARISIIHGSVFHQGSQTSSQYSSICGVTHKKWWFEHNANTGGEMQCWIFYVLGQVNDPEISFRFFTECENKYEFVWELKLAISDICVHSLFSVPMCLLCESNHYQMAFGTELQNIP